MGGRCQAGVTWPDDWAGERHRRRRFNSGRVTTVPADDEGPSRAPDQRHIRQANSPPTWNSTPTIRSTGTRGATRPSPRPPTRTSRSSCPSATRPATGATSWPTSPSRTRRWPTCSTPRSSPQGGPRGAARRRRRLHGGRPGHHRLGRLADERVPHPGSPTLLRRHLLPARRPSRPPVVPHRARAPSPTCGTTGAARSRSRPTSWPRRSPPDRRSPPPPGAVSLARTASTDGHPTC